MKKSNEKGMSGLRRAIKALEEKIAATPSSPLRKLTEWRQAMDARLKSTAPAVRKSKKP